MLSAWTAAGIAFSAWTATFSQAWPVHEWGWGYLFFALAVLAVAFLGIWIIKISESIPGAVFGYGLVTGVFGLFLGPLVASYDSASVVKVFVLTVAVVLALGFIGVIAPDLAAWAKWLFGGLLFIIGGYILLPILGAFGIPVGGALTWIDIIALIIFGALVIYDLNRAVRLPHTHKNAIDSAVAIYLDFINIFIRLLSLMGGRK